MGRALAKPITQPRLPMMGFASLDPSYGLARQCQTIVFDCAIILPWLDVAIAAS
jgi:hypothetical protein